MSNIETYISGSVQCEHCDQNITFNEIKINQLPGALQLHGVSAEKIPVLRDMMNGEFRDIKDQIDYVYNQLYIKLYNHLAQDSTVYIDVYKIDTTDMDQEDVDKDMHYEHRISVQERIHNYDKDAGYGKTYESIAYTSSEEVTDEVTQAVNRAVLQMARELLQSYRLYIRVVTKEKINSTNALATPRAE